MKFNDDEKRIMILLRKWDSKNNFISNILCDFQGVLPPPLNNPTVFRIFFPNERETSCYILESHLQVIDAHSLWCIVRRKIVILLNLLRYLEEENYIRKVDNPCGEKDIDMPNDYILFQPMDAAISKELYELGKSTFIVLPKLDELISNDFKTEEDRKLEQEDKRAASTLNVARAALIVSIVSVAVSIASIIASFQPTQVLLKWPFFSF